MLYLNHEITIEVQGLKLQEYSPEFDAERTRLTCWIASEAGKEFVVRWERLEDSPYKMAMFPKVDGAAMSARWTNGKAGSSVIRGIPTSAATIRLFQFASLETTDDDASPQNPNVQDIGDIVADLWEIETGEPCDETFAVISDEKVHERSKKAMTHRIGHGQLQERDKGQTLKMFKKSHIGEFVFKYRSLAFLQAQGLAPPPVDVRSPRAGEKRPAEDDGSPTPEGGDGFDSKARDQAELKKLLARVDELQSRLANDEARPSSSKRVKTEPRPVVFSNEVIDLTED